MGCPLEAVFALRTYFMQHPICWSRAALQRSALFDGCALNLIFNKLLEHSLQVHSRTTKVNKVKYYAAIQSVLSPEKAETVRQAHVEFLARMVAERHIYARGRFPDGSGGLTIYQAETLEEARKLAEADPYVMHGVRRLELREWAMKVGS
jgi:uncharacterized protein YciI